MATESENINKLRKLERITQDGPGGFTTRIIPSINTLKIIDDKSSFAFALLTFGEMKNKLIIYEERNYKQANKIAKLYQEKAPEMGNWEIYLN